MKAHFEVYPINGQNHELFILNNVDIESHNKLYIPKLKYIQFRYSKGIFSTYLSSQVFKDQFSKWAKTLVDQINGLKDNEEKIALFNKSIKELVLIGKRGKVMSRSEALGLFGELYFLRSLVHKNMHDIGLSAWQRPSPAIHDFDFNNHSLEIKSFGRSATEIKISSIDQLTSLSNKDLYLGCLRFSIDHSHEYDSLGDLYEDIYSNLSPINRVIFEKKCIESKYSPYGGPSDQRVPYKISNIDSKFLFVDPIDFPSISRSQTHFAITSVKYDLSISYISKFAREYEFKI